ncbi:MAG: dihydropteroate synthase [Candidatus Omnitrophica bacterium]|nr:dihydropteroate synthase [Candidatus Omnitrophota bacterium]
MFVIGELINGMYLSIASALKERNKAVIQQCALKQIKAGADALDINCGPHSANPVEDMRWLVETVQEVTDKMLVLDASKISVIESGLSVIKNPVMINSTTADAEKLSKFIPLALKYKAKLIGLTMDIKGVPQNRDRRLELAATIVEYCLKEGFPVEDLYLDPVLLPINVAQAQLVDTLEAIRDFKIINDPSPKVVLGLSNISQGTFVRSLINRTFLVMAQSYGLDAAILDPTDHELMNALITAELILNKQIYCDSFLDAYLKK